ncbi:Uncharacterised protein [uncultured archaeon]|nr:Uncharacterised protein [uncultured archaeon]
MTNRGLLAIFLLCGLNDDKGLTVTKKKFAVTYSRWSRPCTGGHEIVPGVRCVREQADIADRTLYAYTCEDCIRKSAAVTCQGKVKKPCPQPPIF